MHAHPFFHGGNRVHMISLGCPRNRVDTEVMLGSLLQAGYEPTETIEKADYTIINTCGFLEEARRESLDVIEEVLQKKKSGAKVVVAGCMVQNHHEKMRDTYPEIDYFLGSGDVLSVLRAVQAQEQGSVVTSAKSYLEAGEVPRTLSTPPHYAYLKIAEGCRKQCAYCIIPSIKGKLKSKPIARVISEFRLLLDQGVKEVILIAQDLGDFGKDMGFVRRSEGLALLLRALLEDPRPFWLRLLYLYPDEITEELISVIESDSRICRYVDLPIQHINDRILRSMHRATTKQQIFSILSRLRTRLPGIAIRTSLIVGFPGETEEEFEELAAFLSKQQLDEVGIFSYSREPNSKAFSLPNQIPSDVKARRREHLFQLQKTQLEKKRKKEIGKMHVVLMDGYHADSSLLLRGRHQGQCPDIDSEVILNEFDRVDQFGSWYEVQITGVAGMDLIGRVIKKKERP